VVIEAADPWEFVRESEKGQSRGDRLSGELARFRDAILKSARVEAVLDSEQMWASYLTRKGESLRIIYDGERSVEGKAIDYGAWPLVGSPFMRAAVNSAKIELRYGREVRELDFGEWSVRSRVGDISR